MSWGGWNGYYDMAWQQKLAVGACTHVTVIGHYSIRAVLANVGPRSLLLMIR